MAGLGLRRPALGRWPLIAHLAYRLARNDPPGRGIRRLTQTPFPHDSFLSAYAPAADRIAFATDRRYPDFCCNDLFVMRSNGTRETLVHTGLTGVLSPSWGTG